VTDFDAIIVGSGFGGSVMAARLSQNSWQVCLLERGRAYPPGSFARTPHQMARNFWDPSGGMHGLFNIWSFGQLSAVVCSGLGGGSLIYANVELRKDDDTFDGIDGGATWPISRTDLCRYYGMAEDMLGVQTYPFDEAPYDRTPKTIEFTQAAKRAGIEVLLPKLAITFKNDPDRPAVPGEPIDEEYPNLHGMPRQTCRLVGECDLGCNFGSKNSLDYNYLSLAQRTGNADLRTLHEVRSFAPLTDGTWKVDFVAHQADDDTSKNTHDPAVLPIQSLTCRKLIVSAGALGSTFLMLENHDRIPKVSSTLGSHYSGNGDLLTFVDEATKTVDGKTVPRVLDPSVGPVITSTIRVPQKVVDGRIAEHVHYIQDAGYPVFASWLLQETDVGDEIGEIAHAVKDKIEQWLHHSRRTDISSELAEFLRNTNRSADSMPLLGMGGDTPNGQFKLDRDGLLALDWSIDASLPYFDQVRSTARRLATQMGGRLVDDPLWHLSRIVTVHSLGGCPMGESDQDGVVDSYGRVFNYPGLLVCDGSILPGPVGPNPTLTITAVAERCAERLIADGR
jgi:cholesterol oxidase